MERGKWEQGAGRREEGGGRWKGRGEEGRGGLGGSSDRRALWRLSRAGETGRRRPIQTKTLTIILTLPTP